MKISTCDKQCWTLAVQRQITVRSVDGFEENEILEKNVTCGREKSLDFCE